MSRHLGDDMDLPLEPIPGGMPLPDEHVHYSGGVVVMPSAVDLPEVGWKPAIVFRFAIPDGSGFYPAVCLVMDDDQAAKLRPLVVESIQSARREAKIREAGRS